MLMQMCRAPYGARGLKSEQGALADAGLAGRAPYGARGLKFQWVALPVGVSCRAPYGARGLKFVHLHGLVEILVSRPIWGAWIEIGRGSLTCAAPSSRAPYGARGLK